MARLRLKQLSSYKVVLPISLFVGTALGLWEARECAALISGYLASYNYLGAWLIVAVCSILGLFLLAFRRTGWVGGGFILAGFLSCGTFYAGMAVLSKQDRVAWRHEKMVSFGLDQKASVLIYLRKGVTSQEASDFDRDVLEEPTRRPPGHGHPAFVWIYLRLLPSQADGHQAIALTFFPNAPIDKVNAYLAKIKADERVETVYSNTSADSIHSGSKRP